MTGGRTYLCCPGRSGPQPSKKTHVAAVIVGILAGVVLVGASFGGVSAQQGGPTEIKDWNDLNDTRDDLDGEYVLVNDLTPQTDGYDDVASETANGGAGFKPIGSSTPFTGNFSGNGHNITGLYINRPSTSEVGLFGEADGKARITNLNLVDVNITGDNIVGGMGGRLDAIINSSSVSGRVSAGGGFESRAGGFVGRAQEGLINNSHASVNVTATANKVGGFVGGIQSGANIKNSYATGDVSSSGNEVGGFVGNVRESITNSYAEGEVTGKNEVGGFIGYVDDLNLKINESYSTGSVSGNKRVGGFVGVNRQETNITESYSTGDVSGNESVGGFAGENAASSIINTYSTGAVSGGNKTGGLVGENGGAPFSPDNATVINSYAAGTVEGNQRVGGLLGQNGGDGEEGTFFPNDGGDGVLSDSYWDVNETGQTDAIGKEGGDSGTESSGGSSFVDQPVENLETSQMQGITPTQQGKDTMAEFGFARDGGNTWFAVVGGEEINPTPAEDGYPILQAPDIADQLEAQGVEAQPEDGADDQFGLGDFQVTAITDQTPSEVSPTDSFTVQYTVENVGENTARQAVRLELNGEQVATKPDTLTPGQAVTNSFTEVTLPDDASPGDTVSLTVRTNDDAETVELNVTNSGGPPAIADYATEQNVVTISGVSDAIGDWQSGDINIGLVSDVITAWQSGDPIG